MDTWDFSWQYAIWRRQGLVALPNRNLISNLGFGAGATHTVQAESRWASMPTSELGVLEHPAQIGRDVAADRWTFEHVFCPAEHGRQEPASSLQQPVLNAEPASKNLSNGGRSNGGRSNGGSRPWWRRMFQPSSEHQTLAPGSLEPGCRKSRSADPRLRSGLASPAKVAIISPYATVAPHFETELEIAQRHLDAGDAVHMIACQGEQTNCDFNRFGNRERCAKCKLRRRHGWSKLDSQTPGLLAEDALSLESEDLAIAVPEFQSIAEIKNHQLDGFDIGYAVLSSVVSEVRDPDIDLRQHRELVTLFYQSAWAVYRWCQRYLARELPDRVYVFNGRFAAMRAILRACQAAGVDCQLHERGGGLHKFELYPNHLPHDLDGVHQMIIEYWEKAELEKRERIASQWFEGRYRRVETDWHSFVKDQQENNLPDNWNPHRHNVTLFCSSDDEFVAIGDTWQNDLYPNQRQAIEAIVDSTKSAPDFHLYIRMHPNVAGQDNETVRQLRKLNCHRHITVIAPEDPIDTYRLMFDSQAIVSFGSSVGIEAVYWGKPSILLGPCLYRGLGGTYRASSHAAAVELILDARLSPQDRTPALIYGHWLASRGIDFQYFEPESLFHGKFKRQVIFAQPEAEAAIEARKRRAEQSPVNRFKRWIRCRLGSGQARKAA